MDLCAEKWTFLGYEDYRKWLESILDITDETKVLNTNGMAIREYERADLDEIYPVVVKRHPVSD